MLHFIHEFLFGSGSQFVQLCGGLTGGIIGTGVSALSGVYSLFKGGQARKRERAAIEEQNKKYGDLANWYDSEGSKDFLDTSAASSVLGKLRDQYKQGLTTANSNIARGGGTEEANIAAKSAMNSNYNKALNSLVGYGTQYKENMHRDYGNVLGTMANNTNRMNAADVKSWGNAASNSFGALSDVLGSTDWKKK